MTHDKLKQLFDQNADRWSHKSLDEVARQTMTSERFIEVVSALIADKQVSEVPRPQFKDYFPEGTSVQDIQKMFRENKQMYEYTVALDSYIDYIETFVLDEPDNFLGDCGS